MSGRMSPIVSAFVSKVTSHRSTFQVVTAFPDVHHPVHGFVESYVRRRAPAGASSAPVWVAAVTWGIVLTLTILFGSCALRLSPAVGPELVSEMPLGTGEELVVRVYELPPVPPDDSPHYAYWVCEKRSPARRAFLTRGRYEGMPIHASDDLRFLVMDYTIMAGISDVGAWRRVQGASYEYVDAGLGWEEAFDYYVREWKAEHAGPEDKNLPLPDRGAQVQVSFVRWTKLNREILLSLDSQYGGPNAKEYIDHWYFLCDLETLQLSRDLTGVDLPPDKDPSNDQTGK